MDPDLEANYERRLRNSPAFCPPGMSRGDDEVHVTPLGGVYRRRRYVPYGDRFIPTRAHAIWSNGAGFSAMKAKRSLLDDLQRSPSEKKFKSVNATSANNGANTTGTSSSANNRAPSGSSNSKVTTPVEAAADNLTYQVLLQNELLNTGIEDMKDVQGTSKRVVIPSTKARLFTYQNPALQKQRTNYPSPYSVGFISDSSTKLLNSPQKPQFKIPKIPFKVLDAPELQDDFYLNLVDWSSQNVLSVGLGTCVYLWSACTSQVTRLCDLQSESDTVTSVSWSDRGNYVAVGTNNGYVQIWDVAATKRVQNIDGHTARVGALAWNGDVLCSGSRDRLIIQRDIRNWGNTQKRLEGHTQEVCGLKWSPDHQYLASGGNDNKLHIWNINQSQAVQTYSDHIAAVKAIAWSPHQHGLLASGGGTADRYIRFWNTLTGQPLHAVDTASQVCNLVWSKHSSELVSTHGYSQNQIVVWKYPSLTQVAKLRGHTTRVLYLAMSPDGEAIVTGAGDETLRFWNVFSKQTSPKPTTSMLNLFSKIR